MHMLDEGKADDKVIAVHINDPAFSGYPDVLALAAAFGGVGASVQGAASVETEITAAVKRGGLSVIEVGIDPTYYRRQM